MDCDLNKWLKDDLGMGAMSEADLYGILYHPRHGTLCRNFLKFLAESLLCSKKYPDVYVREEYEETLQEFDQKTAELKDIKRQLEIAAESHENDVLELAFLEKKFEYLKDIEHLIRKSNELMEEVVNRPISGIEKIAERIEAFDSLGYKEHEKIYSKTDFSRATPRLVPTNENLRSTIDMIENLHGAITGTCRNLETKIDVLKTEFQPSTIDIHNLASLELPQVQEVVEEPEKEAHKLRSTNIELCDKIKNLNQQVVAMRDKFYGRIIQIEAANDEVLAEYKRLSIAIEDIESQIEAKIGTSCC